MTTMKKLLTISVMSLAAAGFNPALAHSSAEPKHGGIVQGASELSFELVPQAGGALLYVEDHGKPMAPTGMSGKLTVLNGSERSEAELKPVGDKLAAEGVKLVKGSKVVAALTTANKKAITVRFSIR